MFVRPDRGQADRGPAVGAPVPPGLPLLLDEDAAELADTLIQDGDPRGRSSGDRAGPG